MRHRSRIGCSLACPTVDRSEIRQHQEQSSCRARCKIAGWPYGGFVRPRHRHRECANLAHLSRTDLHFHQPIPQPRPCKASPVCQPLARSTLNPLISTRPQHSAGPCKRVWPGWRKPPLGRRCINYCPLSGDTVLTPALLCIQGPSTRRKQAVGVSAAPKHILTLNERLTGTITQRLGRSEQLNTGPKRDAAGFPPDPREGSSVS